MRCCRFTVLLIAVAVAAAVPDRLRKLPTRYHNAEWCNNSAGRSENYFDIRGDITWSFLVGGDVLNVTNGRILANWSRLNGDIWNRNTMEYMASSRTLNGGDLLLVTKMMAGRNMTHVIRLSWNEQEGQIFVLWNVSLPSQPKQISPNNFAPVVDSGVSRHLVFDLETGVLALDGATGRTVWAAARSDFGASGVKCVTVDAVSGVVVLLMNNFTADTFFALALGAPASGLMPVVIATVASFPTVCGLPQVANPAVFLISDTERGTASAAIGVAFYPNGTVQTQWTRVPQSYENPVYSMTNSPYFDHNARLGILSIQDDLDSPQRSGRFNFLMNVSSGALVAKTAFSYDSFAKTQSTGRGSDEIAFLVRYNVEHSFPVRYFWRAHGDFSWNYDLDITEYQLAAVGDGPWILGYRNHDNQQYQLCGYKIIVPRGSSKGHLKH